MIAVVRQEQFMSNRRLSDWASIAEIVASISVVISLLFVGFQVRENTTEMQAAQSNSFYDAVREIELAALSNEHLMDPIAKGLSGRRSEMSDQDISYYRSYIGSLFTVWEQVYFRSVDGSISNDFYQSWEESFSVYLRSGLTPEDLDVILSWFGEEFSSKVLSVAKSIED
jgi:hypothetical protein